MSAHDAVDGSSTRHVSAEDVGTAKAPTIQRSYPCKRSRQSVSTSPSRSCRSTALMPLAQVVICRQLKRRAVLAFFQKLACLIGIEACAWSHHRSRELQALGHTVRLMPPAYVKPYVKRQKNDMADAEGHD